MEFYHYFNSTPASGLTIRSLIPYNGAVGIGDFTVNAASNFTGQDIDDSESDESFTSIITFNKNLSNAQTILSNHSSLGGFTVGLTAGNFPYVDAHSPTSRGHVFTNINLGNKNCIVIKKVGQSFSVYKYDLLSRVFESVETFAFPPSTHLYSSEITTLARTDNNYPSRYGNGNIGFFNGTVEQFVYLSGAVEDSYLLSILSGFLPSTKTPSNSSTYSLLDESYRFPEGVYSSGYAQIASYLSGTNNHVLTGDLASGRWFGTGYGTISSDGLTGNLSYATGINSCYGSGVVYTTTYTGAGTGVYTSFSDTVRLYKSELTTVSHNLTFSRLGQADFHVDHDASYRLTTTSGNSFSSDDAYYTGFKLDGIVSETIPRVVLGTDTGVAPTGYNINGLFDTAVNLFYLPGWTPGGLYYNGTGYSSNYIRTGVYVDISGSTEVSSDYMIGDNSSGSTFLNSGANHWATGKFYPNSSLVFQDNFLTGRLRRTQYLETSSHHLYHKSPIQPTGSVFLFQL